MKKIFFTLLFFAFASQFLMAQYGGNQNRGGAEMNRKHPSHKMQSYEKVYPDSPRNAVCFSLQGSLQMPAGNLYNRFGNSKAVGMAIYYKAKNNFCYGIMGDYFFGNKVKEPNLFKNISTADGYIIMQDGDYAEIKLYERGYYFGPTIGYIDHKLLSSNKNTGLSFWLTSGYMEHKITILGDNVLQLQGDYKKGYDRLSAGFFIQEGVFYNHMSLNRLVNYRIGLEMLEGFTQGLRAVNFDTGESGKQNRFDCLLALKVGWFLPVFIKDNKPRDYTY